jgi:hypothetical protein
MKKSKTLKSNPDSLPAPTRDAPPSLEHIRAESLRERVDVARNSAQTIAQLEAWRDEIEATIAFLKAQGK